MKDDGLLRLSGFQRELRAAGEYIEGLPSNAVKMAAPRDAPLRDQNIDLLIALMDELRQLAAIVGKFKFGLQYLDQFHLIRPFPK